jgi:hypothetical protein
VQANGKETSIPKPVNPARTGFREGQDALEAAVTECTERRRALMGMAETTGRQVVHVVNAIAEIGLSPELRRKLDLLKTEQACIDHGLAEHRDHDVTASVKAYRAAGSGLLGEDRGMQRAITKRLLEGPIMVDPLARTMTMKLKLDGACGTLSGTRYPIQTSGDTLLTWSVAPGRGRKLSRVRVAADDRERGCALS